MYVLKIIMHGVVGPKFRENGAQGQKSMKAGPKDQKRCSANGDGRLVVAVRTKMMDTTLGLRKSICIIM